MKLASTVLVAVGLFGSVASPVLAGPAPIQTGQVASTGTQDDALLPAVPSLKDGVLAEVQADGLAFAVAGMVLGGLGGLVSYTVGVAVDAYHGDGWNFNVSDAQKEIYKGEAGAAFVGLLTPEP